MTGEVLARPESNEVVIPGTGEVVNLTDPTQVAGALHALKQHNVNVGAARHLLESVLAEESGRVGTKTLRVGTYVAVVGADSELDWDLTELVKLLKAGLPAERYADLVTEVVTYKVNASVASQIEKSNPKYARIVNRARKRTPKRPSVKVDAA